MRVPLFMDWQVATNHWKQDSMIRGGWTPAQDWARTPGWKPSQTFMSLMAALQLTSHRPVKLSQRVYADPLLMSRWDVTTQPQEKAGGERQCTPGTITQTMTCRSMVCLELLSTGSGQGSALTPADSHCSTDKCKRNCCAKDLSCASALMGLSGHTKSTKLAAQELIWLKAFLQWRFRDIWDYPEPLCQSCMLLPGGAAASGFLGGSTGAAFSCGYSSAVYIADEGERRKRKLQLHLSSLSKYRLNNWNNLMYLPTVLYGCCKIRTKHCSGLFRLQNFSDSGALEGRKKTEIIWCSKGWWQLSQLKQPIAAFLARKRLQSSVWQYLAWTWELPKST